MTRKRESLQAYFAGIFDGEGTVGIYNFDSNKSWKATLAIQMNEPLAVALLYREYPEGVFSRTKAGAFRFVLNGQKGYNFLREIKPYSIVKHEQVKVALAFLTAQRRWRAKDLTRDEYIARAEHLSATIKVLKDTHDNWVNSVNLWPEMSREYRSKRVEAEDDVRAILRHMKV